MTDRVLAERRERLRSEAAARGLDGVFVFSWRRRPLAWLTGYTPGFLTNYGTLWLPVSGRPVIGVGFGFDGHRAFAETGLDVVPTSEPAAIVPPGPTRIGLVTGDFAVNECPPALCAELVRRGIRTTDLTPFMDELRSIKSAQEVHDLVAATRMAYGSAAVLEGRDLIGCNDFEIAGTVEAELRRSGAQRALCLVGIGDGSAVTEPNGVVVRANDVVCIELTVHTQSACSQIAKTILPASPARHAVRAVHASLDAREAVVRALRTGEPIIDAVREGQRSLRLFGLEDALEYDFGHGVGVDTPEHPVLSCPGKRLAEVGMVVIVHIGIRRPGGETAFVGGPVVIRDNGAHELLDDATWVSDESGSVERSRFHVPVDEDSPD